MATESGGWYFFVLQYRSGVKESQETLCSCFTKNDTYLSKNDKKVLTFRKSCTMIWKSKWEGVKL